ncbi:MAG: hypothetical protein ACOH2Q_21615 [Rhodococcus sp. (in: high G+C Gram-positive bacteria)]
MTTTSTAGRTANIGSGQFEHGSSILVVRVEEVGARHWWVALLATLASQSGNAYMRFVGVVDEKPAYFSATFPVPRMWGTIPPQEQWAPGMTRCLDELCREIEDAGWRLHENSIDPWSLSYERNSPPPAGQSTVGEGPVTAARGGVGDAEEDCSPRYS